MLWRVTLFDNLRDKEPSRVGYFYAADLNEAGLIASASSGDAQRIDLEPTVARPVLLLAGSRTIFWEIGA